MANSELIPPGLDLYSQTDRLNQKFKRRTTVISVICGIVFLLLIFELTGILPVSPFQTSIKNPIITPPDRPLPAH